jgi:hypothetical protein
MGRVKKKLQSVLEGYVDFLRGGRLATPKHQTRLVRWVREFLLFAEDHRGYTFEQTLDLFLARLGERAGIKPWQQIQQASDAIRIYRYQYRSGARGTEDGTTEVPLATSDDGLLAQLREVIRGHLIPVI